MRKSHSSNLSRGWLQVVHTLTPTLPPTPPGHKDNPTTIRIFSHWAGLKKLDGAHVVKAKREERAERRAIDSVTSQPAQI